ncbi:MarR family transcriptional regulator [Ectothiorhodospiraceae bacterium 2226]|nr:MarR family transcriptional regulator [Ectothiorhodospiraceae bacterium 2226]
MHMPNESVSGPRPDDGLRSTRLNAIIRDLRLVLGAIREHSRWVESHCGVSAAQLWALWELATAPGMRVSELSRALTIHQSTASNMLDKLERKALVERVRGGPDQRVVRLYLTEAGMSLLQDAPRPAQGAISSALQSLPDAELEGLHRHLDRLVQAMGVTDRQAALRPLGAD